MKTIKSLFLTTAFFIWGNTVHPQDAKTPTEFHVKAAYLYLFGKYITWPEESLPNFTIGVYGHDPFGPIMEEVLTGKHIRNKPVIIKRFRPDTKIESCQILYIGRDVAIDQNLLEEMNHNGILTIGENPKFLAKGGAIRYHLSKNRVHFSINLAVINQLNLKPSSQLLKIAHKVVK